MASCAADVVPLNWCRCNPPLSAKGEVGLCRSCNRQINPAVLATDETHNAFLNELQWVLEEAEGWPNPAEAGLPEEWVYFRSLCLDRERAGRAHYGNAHLGRDNIQSGFEENTDGSNYGYFDFLQSIQVGRDECRDLAFQAAFYDYMAYKTRLQMRSKRLGSH